MNLLKKKRLKGIHVAHNKNTKNLATERLPLPEKVYLSMAQNIGAKCDVVVEVGDHVDLGQPVGDTDIVMSAPVHASVSGKVVSIEKIMSIMGTMDKHVVIESDGRQTTWEGVKPPVIETRDDFIKAIKDSGVVGLGGAAFPVSVKYNPRNIEMVDTLIVNGAECEPYITSDYRTMLEETNSIVDGIEGIMKWLDIKDCYIGIEDNKPEAIARLYEAIEGNYHIHIVIIKSIYPRGAERVMIYETTGKVLPPGKLPADIGVLVSNVATVSFIGKYLATGMPLVEKRITVDGDAVTTPKNLMVPLGTKIVDIIDFCGGYKLPPAKIIMGGPMMGRAIYNDGKPLIKNNNAILVFDEKQAFISEETPCINCGRCVRACPMDLMPTLINRAYLQNDYTELRRLNVQLCMGCGCCSYVCPATRRLNIVHLLAKAKLKELDLKEQKAKERKLKEQEAKELEGKQ